MRPVLAEIGLVLGEDLAEVALVHDEGTVEDFAAYAADLTFHDGVHLRRLGRGEQYADALGLEHFVEHHGELAIPVPDQEPEVAGPITQSRA